MAVVCVSASGRPPPKASAQGAVDGTHQNLPRVVLSQPQGPLVSVGTGPAWRPSSRTSSGAQTSTTSRMADVSLPVVRRDGRPVAPVAPSGPCSAQQRLQPSSLQHMGRSISIVGESMPVIRSGPRSAVAKPKPLHRSALVASPQEEPRSRSLPRAPEGPSADGLPVVRIRKATPRRSRAGKRQPTIKEIPSLAVVCSTDSGTRPAARAQVATSQSDEVPSSLVTKRMHGSSTPFMLST